MKKFVSSFAILLAMAVAASSVQSQTGSQDIPIEHSITGKPIKCNAKLLLPNKPGPHSVVVLVNSSAGKNDVFLDAIPGAFVAQGIAVVVLDTFTPRGVSDTIYDASKVTSVDMGADALAALKYLRRDSRFRSNKIAIAGHSRGGTLAY